jgi:hypothetical protein
MSAMVVMERPQTVGTARSAQQRAGPTDGIEAFRLTSTIGVTVAAVNPVSSNRFDGTPRDR